MLFAEQTFFVARPEIFALFSSILSCGKYVRVATRGGSKYVKYVVRQLSWINGLSSQQFEIISSDFEGICNQLWSSNPSLN